MKSKKQELLSVILSIKENKTSWNGQVAKTIVQHLRVGWEIGKQMIKLKTSFQSLCSFTSRNVDMDNCSLLPYQHVLYKVPILL